MSTASLTYQEIAARFGVTTPSARNLVRRKGWPKTLGNDGLARIVVPSDAIPDEPPIGADPSTVQSSQWPEGSTVQPSQAHIAIQVLERHIERLEVEVAALKGDRDVLASMPVQVAALKATLEAVTDERDRWEQASKAAWARAATGPSVPAQRRWWLFRRSA